MKKPVEIWRRITWRHIGLAVALAFVVYGDLADVYSLAHQPTRITGTVRDKNGAPIEHVIIWLFVKEIDGSGFAESGADGSFEGERQAGRGVTLKIEATHREFQPYTSSIAADRGEHELQITLEHQPEWRPVIFNAGDLAEVWTGTDWCDAKVVMVGRRDIPTPDGGQDMTGKYLIQVNPRHFGLNELWESQSALRPGGLRGNRECFGEE